MIARVMRLKCAGYGPDVTTSDKFKSAVVMIGGTLVLALLWVWAKRQFGESYFTQALSPMAWLFPYLLGLRYTSLKGRSASVQTIFIVGLSAALVALVLLVGLIGSRV